jgi:hypothetical protein
VRLVVSGAAAGSEQALEALRTVARDYTGMVLDEEDLAGDGALLSDDQFVAAGAFPWLGLLGDRGRQVSDHRTLLKQDAAAIAETWQRFDGRTPDEAPTPGKANRRRRRRRSPRPQPPNGQQAQTA